MFFVPSPLFPTEQARPQSYCLIRDQKALHRNAHGCAYVYNSIDAFHQRPLGHNNSSSTDSPPLSKTANLESLSGILIGSFRVSLKYTIVAMASRPIQCAECGTLLYIACPGTVVGSVDFGNPVRLTAEQMIITDIVCPSTTCPAHSKVIDLGPIGIEFMEQVVEQPWEQAESLFATDTNTYIVGEQGDWNNELPNSQQQQQEQEQQAPPPQEQQELTDTVPIENTTDMIVHFGKNPCRRCFRLGKDCRWEPNEEDCARCRGRARRPNCIKSLFRANPRGPWVNKIIPDNVPHCSVDASAMRFSAATITSALHYLVKWPFRPTSMWNSAEVLRDYPDILKAFHLANPRSPGPADWLVNGDAEFAGLLAFARDDLREAE